MKKHNKAFEELCEKARLNVNEITADKVKMLMDTEELPIFIDVREDSEWHKDHLPGAIHLGRGIIERDIDKIAPDMSTTIILYCGGGYRSVLAAESLQKMGYNNVLSMTGGYRGWVMAGYPLETETRE